METIYNFFSDKDRHTHISNKELITINTTLKNINNEFNIDNTIDTPNLVVVGSQSSGKSTLINRMLGFEVIPVGSKMETRTPINIQLIPNKKIFLEFGHYENLKWIKTKTIPITDLKNEIDITKIQNEIKIQTKINAGESMGISAKEINIKFYSPDVTDLNFIDLPGLTMIACTDRGQPKDIKEQIQNLIANYISKPNTIILCVMPAREDLETDMALELVKKYDNHCKRTIGVLTKVDLMNTTSDISHYIEGDISKDLKLNYGYFAVKNNEDELDFFNNHKIYSKLMKTNRLGIKNLGNSLSTIFLNKIKDYIPTILQNIDTLLTENNNQLTILGNPLPTNNETKQLVLTKYITDLSSDYLNNLENRYSKMNTGRQIKEVFIQFRKKIDLIDPFGTDVDENLITIIKNSDGNHMSMPLPTIEILEGCLHNNKLDCYKDFIPISLDCLTQITVKLEELLIELLNTNGIHKYKNLHETIKKDIYNNLILVKKDNTLTKIKECINTEKCYIWTDNVKFKDLLKQIPNTFTSNEIDITILKKILNEYFTSVKEIVKHNIPKVIMYYLVREVEKELNVYSLNNIHKNNYLQFFSEDDNIQKKREKYESINCILDKTKKTLENLK
jgi:GTP-binding protein EngB required for normal cell division